MQAAFRGHFVGAVCFREDATLVGALATEAAPVLDALHVALAPRDPPRALHEAYALTTLLARRAALLGATPSAALGLSAALIAAVREAGCAVDEAEARALAIVAVEGYCAARDERVTADLLAAAARTQVAVPLGPRCLAIFLAGCHDERALTATLDRLARQLLHDEIASCLLDVSRLLDVDAADDAFARAVASFCATALTLGAALTLIGASPVLRDRLARWLPRAPLHFADDFPAGHAHALSEAGLVLKARLRWPRAGWPRARGSPR
ncbi:MAG: hypothetical protein ABW252_17295 [Polyangiales bacterium]